MHDDTLLFSLETNHIPISSEILENIVKDMIQVFKKYVDLADDLEIDIQPSKTDQNDQISLILTGHVIFHS